MKEKLKEQINKIKKGALLTTAISAGLTLSSNKASAQNIKSYEKNNVPENVALTSRPSYENYHLSFEERKAALDEAVKNGSVRAVEEENDGMMKAVKYYNKENKVVATNDFIDTQSVSFTFYTSKVPLEYTILENGMEVQLEGKDLVDRSDEYSFLGTKGIKEVQTQTVIQNNENIHVVMEFEGGKITRTTIDNPPQKEATTKLERNTYDFINASHTKDIFEKDGQDWLHLPTLNEIKPLPLRRTPER